MNCIGNLIALFCTQPYIGSEWPSARIIHVPPGYIEPASPQARADWERRCQPRTYRDRYGVTRWTYALAGCEYGP